MQKNIVKKGLAVAVIFLFVAISFQPVFAKDTILPMKKSDTKELLETIKDLVNNKEIQDIIQKSEIKGSPIRFQQLLGRLQKEIIGAIEKNDAFNERIKQLSGLPCDCEKDNSTGWSFPFICTLLFLILYVLWLVVGFSVILFGYYPSFISNLLLVIEDIASKLNCWWYPY